MWVCYWYKTLQYYCNKKRRGLSSGYLMPKKKALLFAELSGCVPPSTARFKDARYDIKRACTQQLSISNYTHPEQKRNNQPVIYGLKINFPVVKPVIFSFPPTTKWNWALQTVALLYYSVILIKDLLMKPADSKPLFTLSVTAEIMGVHPRTLMIYENEGLVVPARTKTNRRRYSQRDIKKLQFVRYLTNKKGVNLAGVAAILKLLSLAERNRFDLQKPTFPDFTETSIV